MRTFQSENQNLIDHLWFRLKMQADGAKAPYVGKEEPYELDWSKAPRSWTIADLQRLPQGEPIQFIFGITGGAESSRAFHLPDTRGKNK